MRRWSGLRLGVAGLVSAVVVSGAASGVVGSAAVAGVSVGAADGGQGEPPVRESGVAWTTPALVQEPPSWVEPTVVWPKPDKAKVKVPKSKGVKAAVGKSAVKIERPKKEKGKPVRAGGGEPVVMVPDAVTVDVADAAAAEAAGGVGVVFTVAADAGSSGGELGVAIDASGFRDAFGEGLLSRLRVARIPVCVADAVMVGAPIPDDCEVSTDVVDTVSVDSSTGLVSADVTVPDPVAGRAAAGDPVPGDPVAAYALMSVSSGAEGNFGATPLTVAGSWQVGVGSGSFTYSLPLPGAPTLIGDVPQVSLSYDSGSIDGMTAGDNAQAPVVGAGWSLNDAYIEQLYDGYSNAEGRSDFKYAGEKYRIVFGGRASILVKDADLPGRQSGETGFRLREDPRWRVYLTPDSGKPNEDGSADARGRTWRVVTPDGSTYMFGTNYVLTDGASRAATNSVLTIPVRGTDAALDECGDGAYCEMAWRWMLDRVVDVKRMQTAYFYDLETNHYTNAAGSLVTYARGVRLSKITYGRKSVTNAGVTPTAYMDFRYGLRCNAQVVASSGDPAYGSATCPSPTAANASAYPDVPLDLQCGGSCSKRSPSFWTAYLLQSVQTNRDDSGTDYPTGVGVDRYSFRYKPGWHLADIVPGRFAAVGDRRCGFDA